MPSHVDPAIYVTANIGGRGVVARAMQRLGLSQASAVGHLVMFWGNAAMNSDDGRVAHLTDLQLEQWACWQGKRGRFAAWLRAEHLDEHGRPNEWDEYAGKLVASRAKARDKKRQQRGQSPSRPGDSPGDKRGTVPGTVPGTSRGLSTRAREEGEGEGEGERKEGERERERTTLPDTPRARDVRETLTAPQRLVIAANHAITARWGEQTNPLLPGHGPTVQLAEDLQRLDVPLDVAEVSIARQVQAKADGPPRSMAYFRGGIVEDWERQKLRALSLGVEPLTAPTGRVRSADLIPAELCDG